jgi:hypothetical protein
VIRHWNNSIKTWNKTLHHSNVQKGKFTCRKKNQEIIIYKTM